MIITKFVYLNGIDSPWEIVKNRISVLLRWKQIEMTGLIAEN